jgi:Na+-transporting methylmalonyl-CoA/oxaloacetate decarboxylase gamma subunit
MLAAVVAMGVAIAFLAILAVLLGAWVCHLCEQLEAAAHTIAEQQRVASDQCEALERITAAIEKGLGARA